MLAINLEQACSPDFLLRGKNTGKKAGGSVIALPDKPRARQPDVMEFATRAVRPRFE